MSKNKGFTLIELLIVIGVLGILAAGLMAAVDPFEQLKKARDANNRNAIIELHNAYTRYYATHGALPWDDAAVNPNGCLGVLATFNRGGAQTGVNLSNANLANCVTALENDGELKTGFINALGSGEAAKMYSASPTNAQVIVCFSPEGKGLWQDGLTKYDQNGVDMSATTCAAGAKGTTPNGTCFWCAK